MVSFEVNDNYPVFGDICVYVCACFYKLCFFMQFPKESSQTRLLSWILSN